MIETYVTVHDQALIEQGEAEGRFVNAAPYRYLFVGPRRVDLSTARTVVAREFRENVEQWPSFYDFTGWWALANRGIMPERMLTLQYDHQVPARLDDQINAVLDDHPIGAFVAGHRLANNFMLLIPRFETAYRAGLEACGAPPMETWPDFNEWPSTQGVAWRGEAFIDCLRWLTPCFELWHDHLWAGHLMERMVKAWLVTTGQTEGYLSGIIHEGRDCHGTCHLMGGDRATYDSKAATFGR